MPLLGAALARYAPVAKDLSPRTPYILDGTLLACWSWASHPQLYSGKHKRTGMNVQVACTLTGDLAWISDPIAGNRHDTYCCTNLASSPGSPGTGWVIRGMSATRCSPPLRNR